MQRNAMATASVVMGALSLCFCRFWAGSFLFGGLGVIFALLSAGGERMNRQAKIGLVISMIGIAIYITIIKKFNARGGIC